MTEHDPLDRLTCVADASERPDPDFAERLFDDLLGDLTERSSAKPGPVSLIDLKEREEMDDTPKRWFLPLMGAAAVIALVVGVVALATREDDQPPPGAAQGGDEQVPTTPAATATADQAELEAIALGEALVRALDDHNADTVAELVRDDAAVEWQAASNRADFLRLIDFFAADDTRLELESCTPDRTYDVRCEFLQSNVWSAAVHGAPIRGAVLARVADGQATVIAVQYPDHRDVDSGEPVYQPFLDHARQNHPDEFEAMWFWDPVYDWFYEGPRFTDEALALFEQYTAEYHAATGG